MRAGFARHGALESDAARDVAPTDLLALAKDVGAGFGVDGLVRVDEVAGLDSGHRIAAGRPVVGDAAEVAVRRLEIRAEQVVVVVLEQSGVELRLMAGCSCGAPGCRLVTRRCPRPPRAMCRPTRKAHDYRPVLRTR